MFSEIDKLCFEYNIKKEFKPVESDPTVGNIRQALVKFALKTEPTKFTLDPYPKLKSDKDVGYVTGPEVPVQDGTNGDGETLRKIMRDANNVETTLNFYKIKK